jgi:Ribonuclease G/E
MPKYVAGKDLKSNQDRMFNSTDSDYMNKKSVVKKVIKKLNAEHRRHRLEKALNKMNVEDVVMLGMAIENAIKKEVKARKQTDE